MRYGQVDPVPRDGRITQLWYSRPPAELQNTHTAPAVNTHNGFFFGRRGAGTAIDSGGAQSRTAYFSLRREADLDGFQGNWWRGRHRSHTNDVSQRPFVGHQAGAAPERASRVSSYTTPGSCLSCHGRAPPPQLPPPFGVLPLPPGILPALRDVIVPPLSGSGGGNPKQCAVQYENDAEICRRLPGVGSRRRCWESAAEREAYCIKSKGEVGYPPLRT